MSEDKKLATKFWTDPPNNCTEREARAQIEKYKTDSGVKEQKPDHAEAAEDHAAQNQ